MSHFSDCDLEHRWADYQTLTHFLSFFLSFFLSSFLSFFRWPSQLQRQGETLFASNSLGQRVTAHKANTGSGPTCNMPVVSQFRFTPSSMSQYRYTPFSMSQYRYTPSSMSQYRYTPSSMSQKRSRRKPNSNPNPNPCLLYTSPSPRDDY